LKPRPVSVPNPPPAEAEASPNATLSQIIAEAKAAKVKPSAAPAPVQTRPSKGQGFWLLVGGGAGALAVAIVVGLIVAIQSSSRTRPAEDQSSTKEAPSKPVAPVEKPKATAIAEAKPGKAPDVWPAEPDRPPFPGSKKFIEPPRLADFSDWLQDFEEAKRVANRDNKDVLLFFDGSDWCPDCQALAREVFFQPQFRAATADKYVLVHIDFPQTAGGKVEDAARNVRLGQQLGIGRFPLLLATDREGRVVGATARFPVVLLTDAKGHVLRAEQGYVSGNAGGVTNYLETLANWQQTIAAPLKRAIAAVDETQDDPHGKQVASDQLRALVTAQGIDRFYARQPAGPPPPVAAIAGGTPPKPAPQKPSEEVDDPRPVQTAAEPDSPEGRLASKGLLSANGYFVLSAEADMPRLMRDAEKKTQKSILAAEKTLSTAEAAVQSKKHQVDDLRQRQEVIRAKLAGLNTLPNQNALLATYNQIHAELFRLTNSKQEEEAMNAARTKADEAEQKFNEQLRPISSLYDKMQRQYKKLAADPQVSQAIAEFNRTAGQECQLGPSRSLERNGDKLKKMGDRYRLDFVQCRKGEGNLWTLSVTLNGKRAEEMAVDTGASVVSLPWNMAKAAGLAPGNNVPRNAEMVTADGHTITGWKVTAPTIQIRQFVAEKVECTVMPPEAANASPLLGLSFLRDNGCKFDIDTGKLTLPRGTKRDPSAEKQLPHLERSDGS
jgi:clan AA aspartic protease (TIGR02281 family)